MSFGRALTRGLPRGRRVSLPRPRLSLRSRWVRRLLIVVVLLGALLLGVGSGFATRLWSRSRR